MFCLFFYSAVIQVLLLQSRRLQALLPARTLQATRFRRPLLPPLAGHDAAANTSSAEAEVKEKVNEALRQVQEAQRQIHSSRTESEEQAERTKKDQKFRRAKGAMELKEQGHNLDPSAGHSPEEDSVNDSKAARTRENAASDEAHKPDGTISQSVCQRLMALEELAAARPRRKLVQRGEPVPQLRHHYAAAAWWAVT